MLDMMVGVLLVLLTIFLIMVVLVQRGRGGGLAGALGGAGGQSAFGAKAGDTFTRITVVTAAIWFLLCIAAVKIVGSGKSDLLQMGDPKDVPASGALYPVPATEGGTADGAVPQNGPGAPADATDAADPSGQDAAPSPPSAPPEASPAENADAPAE